MDDETKDDVTIQSGVRQIYFNKPGVRQAYVIKIMSKTSLFYIFKPGVRQVYVI